MIENIIEKNDFLIYYIIKVNTGITLNQISQKLSLSEDYISTKITEFSQTNIPIIYDNLTNFYSLQSESEFTFSVSIGDKVYSYDEETIIENLISEEEKVMLSILK